MSVELLKLYDCKWGNHISHLQHDIYHLAAYLDAISMSEIGQPSAALTMVANSYLLTPIFFRGLGEFGAHFSSYYDVCSPYGYAGPICSTENIAEVQLLLKNFQTEGKNLGFVSSFIRLHPYLNDLVLWQKVIQEMDNIFLINHGKTVYINLENTAENFLNDLRRDHKYRYNRLKRLGFQFRLNDWSHYERFQELYIDTIRNVAAKPYYFFKKEYFSALKEKLTDKIYLAAVVGKGGELAAGALFFIEDGIVQYHLSGTNILHRKEVPSVMLLVEMINFARTKSCKIFHLGGGYGSKEDSLFAFKAGFSKKYFDFATLRVIHNIEIYNLLVKSVHGEALGFTNNEYFPLYRFSKS